MVVVILNNLYFKNHLNNPEFKTITSQLGVKICLSINEVINNPLFYTESTNDVILIVPLFYTNIINSSNRADKIKSNSIVCEYKLDTLLTFENRV